MTMTRDYPERLAAQLVEWDAEIPEFDRLLSELDRARGIYYNEIQEAASEQKSAHRRTHSSRASGVDAMDHY